MPGRVPGWGDDPAGRRWAPERAVIDSHHVTQSSTAGTPTDATDHHGPAWWALPLALLAGLLTPTQSRINGQLSAEMHDGFTTAVISFTTGLVIVTLLVLATPKARRGTATLFTDLRHGRFGWWWALGGLGGGFFVLAQSLTVTLIGVALFIVSTVAGQSVTGLVVDRYGLGPGGPRPLTPNRVLGAALMVVAVVIAMSASLHLSVSPWLLLMPVVAGVLISLQQALNGRVTAHSGHFLTATLTNFILGTAFLLVVASFRWLRHGLPDALPHNPLLYLGGAIGVIYIGIGAHLAKPLGVLTLSMALVAGQITGSVLIDLLFPASGEHLGWTTIVGAGLTLVAAAITAGLFGRRRR